MYLDHARAGAAVPHTITVCSTPAHISTTDELNTLVVQLLAHISTTDELNTLVVQLLAWEKRTKSNGRRDPRATSSAAPASTQ
jgi:hypothetical protein|eukprot:COSAG03_NODE_15_length_22165_cov_72.809934_18_plen_83_part_00